MTNTQLPNSSRPNKGAKRQPNQPRYQPVEQADDEQIAEEQRTQPKHSQSLPPQGVQVGGENQEHSEQETGDELGEELGDEQWAEDDANDDLNLDSDEQNDEDTDLLANGRRRPNVKDAGDTSRQKASRQ